MVGQDGNVAAAEAAAIGERPDDVPVWRHDERPDERQGDVPVPVDEPVLVDAERLWEPVPDDRWSRENRLEPSRRCKEQGSSKP